MYSVILTFSWTVAHQIYDRRDIKERSEAKICEILENSVLVRKQQNP